MSDSVSKYYEMEEDREYWLAKAREDHKSETRFDRFKAFISGLFSTTKN